jgi:hypothetical protein
LEIGISIETASCYFAAAIDEILVGTITCVVLIDVKENFKPSVKESRNKNFNKITR